MNLSIVIPVYNERENLQLLFDALYAVMNNLKKSWEVILVDDGSRDKSLAVLKEYAEKDNPEFRLVTDDIEEVFKRVESKYPELLHPNLSKVTLRPWGAKEFALMDGQIGIVIQQW